MDFSAVRKDEVPVTFAISAHTMTGYQNLVAVTGTASSTWASTTTCVLGTRSGTTTGTKDWGREGSGTLSLEDHYSREITESVEWEPGYVEAQMWYDQSITDMLDSYEYERDSSRGPACTT